MNINLTPQLEEMVRKKVTSGLYTSASEVVREALRLMDERDQLRVAKLDQLRQAIQDGLDSGPAVELDPDDVKRAGRARRAAKMGGGAEMSHFTVRPIARIDIDGIWATSQRTARRRQMPLSIG